MLLIWPLPLSSAPPSAPPHLHIFSFGHASSSSFSPAPPTAPPLASPTHWTQPLQSSSGPPLVPPPQYPSTPPLFSFDRASKKILLWLRLSPVLLQLRPGPAHLPDQPRPNPARLLLWPRPPPHSATILVPPSPGLRRLRLHPSRPKGVVGLLEGTSTSSRRGGA